MLQGLKYFIITIVYSERKLAHGIAKRTHDHVRHQLVSPYERVLDFKNWLLELTY